MTRSFRPAAFVLPFILLACVPQQGAGGGSQPPGGGSLPLRIEPVQGQGGFCRLIDGPSGWNLVVRMHNPNTNVHISPRNVRVTFGTNPPTTRDAQTAALPPNAAQDLSFPLPPGCFHPDCLFSIQVTDSSVPVQASGSCVG